MNKIVVLLPIATIILGIGVFFFSDPYNHYLSAIAVTMLYVCLWMILNNAKKRKEEKGEKMKWMPFFKSNPQLPVVSLGLVLFTVKLLLPDSMMHIKDSLQLFVSITIIMAAGFNIADRKKERNNTEANNG